MLEKLQIIQQRFDEVSDLIIQPDIIADQKRYVQLNKEYKDLSKLVEKGRNALSFDAKDCRKKRYICEASATRFEVP